MHRYACADTFKSDDDCEHRAEFLHGLLIHSSTSTSQLPDADELATLSDTAHRFAYSGLKTYSHTPFAKPATHVHWYAWNDTVVSTVDSVQVA
eukprot:COSAG01_NODE_6433_length_3669_cov_61.729412_1_plen_92_part_10